MVKNVVMWRDERGDFFRKGILDIAPVIRHECGVMKWTCLTPLTFASLSLIGCGSFDRSLGGDFDPLSAPGSTQKSEVSATSNYNFQSGQFVTAASNSTAFFSKRPSGNAEAEELLAAGTSMRVIKSEGSFVKVELDNGKVGYVAAALLSDANAAQAGALPSGAVQVYPPIGGDAALPLPAGSSALPTDMQPASSPLPPSDLNMDAPLPPIAPPTVPEMPPSGGVEVKPGAELPPAAAESKEKAKDAAELPEPSKAGQ